MLIRDYVCANFWPGKVVSGEKVKTLTMKLVEKETASALNGTPRKPAMTSATTNGLVKVVQQ